MFSMLFEGITHFDCVQMLESYEQRIPELMKKLNDSSFVLKKESISIFE